MLGGMGRPSKLTPELHAEIVNLIRLGNFREAAAAAAGIGTTTFHRWMAKGREARSGIYREFWAAVNTAEAQAEATAIGRIRQAAQDPKHWTAAAWYLERKFPERWGRKRLEISGPEGGPVETEEKGVLAPSRAAEILNVLAAANYLSEGGPIEEAEELLDG